MAQPVFRDYDRAALDREYDNRAKVRGFAQHLERFAKRSKQARASLPCRLDVRYGPGAAQTLDIFTASAPGPSPVQVFYHGGYWKAMDKSDFAYVAFCQHGLGAATVVVNYALMPAVSMDELVRQCRAALAWVWHNAPSFGGDRRRIHVSGHSAGGHLVAMLLATDWPRFDAALPSDPIRGACGISGLYDLEPIRLCFLNEELGLSAEEAARNSPVRLERHGPGELLLAVGALEGPEYRRQTMDLADAWAQTGARPSTLVMPGTDHFAIVGLLDDPHSELCGAIRRQMGIG